MTFLLYNNITKLDKHYVNLKQCLGQKMLIDNPYRKWIFLKKTFFLLKSEVTFVSAKISLLIGEPVMYLKNM